MITLTTDQYKTEVPPQHRQVINGQTFIRVFDADRGMYEWYPVKVVLSSFVEPALSEGGER